MPWKRCLAEMWTRDRTGNSTPDSNTRVVRITKHNEPLVNFFIFLSNSSQYVHTHSQKLLKNLNTAQLQCYTATLLHC